MAPVVRSPPLEAKAKEFIRTMFHGSAFIYGAGSIVGIGRAWATRDKGISVEDGLRRLSEAYARGVRVVDTADSYGGGESERTVGRWLQENPAAKVLVQTKVGGNNDGRPGVDLSRHHIDHQLTQSIERMGRVDLYMSHAPDPDTPLEETLAAFADAQTSGRIGAFGMCNVDARHLELIISTAERTGLPRPGWLQNGYNLLNRRDERDVMPLAAAEGIAYTAFSPLAGGVLSERYLDGAPVPPDSRIGTAGDLYYVGMHTPANLEKVSRLRDIARERQISVAGLALAWLKTHPLIAASLVSPSQPSQWQAVDEALDHVVDADTFDRIAEIFSLPDASTPNMIAQKDNR
jgi:aryl-alcohol dehydrogenase-like predicted oxidoreductase